MVLDIVQFEHDKAFVQQVDVLFRVEQVIVFAALIVGFQDVQEILDVEILFPDTLAFEQSAILFVDKFIERVERRAQVVTVLDLLNIQAHSVRQRDFLGAARRFIVPFPQGKNQRLDTFALLNVVDIIVAEKRVETDRIVLGIGKINSVLTARAMVD